MVLLSHHPCFRGDTPVRMGTTGPSIWGGTVGKLMGGNWTRQKNLQHPKGLPSRYLGNHGAAILGVDLCFFWVDPSLVFLNFVHRSLIFQVVSKLPRCFGVKMPNAFCRSGDHTSSWRQSTHIAVKQLRCHNLYINHKCQTIAKYHLQRNGLQSSWDGTVYFHERFTIQETITYPVYLGTQIIDSKVLARIRIRIC